MSKQNQVAYHSRKWDEALKAVGIEADRLRAEKGEAVIGPQNEYFARLVMYETECEQRYNNALALAQ